MHRLVRMLVRIHQSCHREGLISSTGAVAAIRRARSWIKLLTITALGGFLALTLHLLLLQNVPAQRDAPSLSKAVPATGAVDWSSMGTGLISPPVRPDSERTPLRVGAYVTNLSDLDLLENRYSIELLLWSVWDGPPEQNPSDALVVLNGIYDGDIQRFQRVRRERQDGVTWSLYRIRTQVVMRWQLALYPFDRQTLRVEIGFDDPFAPVGLDVVKQKAVSISPGLILPGWLIQESQAYPSHITLMSHLGFPPASGLPLHRQETVVFEIPLQRISVLSFTPDFLGYILAVGLCCMALVISRSRDDLILAAVVSSGGNYVFIADKLPVTAMVGFIGNLQLIVFLGILYVVGADELIDNHLLQVSPRLSNVLRLGLLPSYLIFTLVGIYLIIP